MKIIGIGMKLSHREKNTFQKHTLWDRSSLTQLIVKLPESMKDQIVPGRIDRDVSVIDMYPTLVELYDHSSDPDEWKNLVTEPAHKSLISKLQEQFINENLQDL